VRTGTPRGDAALAVIFLLFVNLLILMVMVIAPHDSLAEHAARTYKLTNFGLAGVALMVGIWRRWFVFLAVFALAQLSSLFWFLPYVNGLPLHASG
jgi:hypothetical protein